MSSLPINSTSRLAARGRLSRRLEYRVGEVHPVRAEVLEKGRPRACGRVIADRAAVRGDSGLREDEQLLHRDLAIGQARDLGNADHLARAAAEPLGLNYHVHRGGDLAANGPRRQLRAGEQDQGFESVERIARVVGMQSAHRAVVTGVHRLEHVESFGTAALAYHDSVWSHAKAVAHEVADGDGASTLDVLRLRLEADDMNLAQAELGRVLARDDALGCRYEPGQDVQESGLAGPRTTRHDDVQARLNSGVQIKHHRGRRPAEADDLVGAQNLAPELPDGQAGTVDGDRGDDDVDPRAVLEAGGLERKCSSVS